MNGPFASIEQAISELKAGRMIIIIDDIDRENEGDLVIAAQFAHAEAINFMSHHGRGLICLPMAEPFIEKLNLPMMTSRNRSPYGTAFTVSIEAAQGVSTGISAEDRAHTIKVAINPKSTPKDIISPGHVFPLKARKGGVLKRRGQTEASVDLMRLAGLQEAAVICEVMNENGTMSRQSDLEVFSKKHGVVMICIQDLVDYRIKNETLIEEQATSRIPLTDFGDFTMTVFSNDLDDREHFVLIKPPKKLNQIPLVRVHSECITGMSLVLQNVIVVIS